ncbi:MAG TPA: hypothetical protein VGJ69_06610 [Pyrinomonadaceae bacterium]|jgi:predicted MarR family transcription regulator
MAEELKLTNEETAALSSINTELAGVSGRVATLAATEGGIGELCDEYHKIREWLLILIKIVRKIPKYGETIAKVLEFLMGIADAVCPVQA